MRYFVLFFQNLPPFEQIFAKIHFSFVNKKLFGNIVNRSHGIFSFPVKLLFFP